MPQKKHPVFLSNTGNLNPQVEKKLFAVKVFVIDRLRELSVALTKGKNESWRRSGQRHAWGCMHVRGRIHVSHIQICISACETSSQQTPEDSLR
jgi:hypothetical protein